MLECREVHVSYGAIQALRGVDVRAEAGRLTVLLGANGAGKTTLVRAVAGLVPLKRGQVLWEGRALPPGTEARCRLGLALVPEGRQLWRGLTVAEHLTLAAYPRIKPWARLRAQPPADVQADAERLLQMFPALKARLRARAETMSGGEQQMLALARALMARPRLVALDEPSVGLAPLVVAQLFAGLRTAVDEGLGVLLVEQNAEAALEVADGGYVLERGRVVAAGSPEVLRAEGVLEDAYLGAGGG